MDEPNILYMAVCFSGKRINVHAKDFFSAVEALKENTKLNPDDPEYLDPKDVFQLIDIPG